MIENEPTQQSDSVDWKEFAQVCERTGEMLFAAFSVYGETLVHTLQPVWNSIQPAIEAVNNATWSAYRQAGSPYGEIDEGLMRWIDDLGNRRNHEAEIERIRQRHETLIHARQLGERIQARRHEE